MNRKINIKKLIIEGLFWVLIIIIMFALLLPIYYMISSSFKTQKQMLDVKQFFIFKPTIKNYQQAFKKYDIGTPLLNSIIVSLSSTCLALLLGLPTAYAIARHRMHKLSTLVLCIRIVPLVTFLVPWFILLTKLSAVGTRGALILVNLITLLPLMIWIVSPYFGSISRELEEAAFLDGCTEAQSFMRIMLPLSSPGIITAAILCFIQVWNNFMIGFVLGGSSAKTLPVMLKIYITYSDTDYAGLMTAAVIVAVPVVLISMCLQKYVISGLTAGSVKG